MKGREGVLIRCAVSGTSYMARLFHMSYRPDLGTVLLKNLRKTHT